VIDLFVDLLGENKLKMKNPEIQNLINSYDIGLKNNDPSIIQLRRILSKLQKEARDNSKDTKCLYCGCPCTRSLGQKSNIKT
jgi:hypothetical protein